MDAGQKKSIFGPYEDLDMLSWMRSAALDPCCHASPQNLQKMRKQVLNVRKFMILSCAAAPQRKRKLDLFLKEKSASPGSCNRRRISKMKMSDPLPSFGSSISCVIDSVDLHGSVQQTLGSSASSPTCKEALDRNQELHCVLNTHDLDVPDSDFTPSMESDESTISPNYAPTAEHETVHGSSSTNSTDKRINNDYLKKPRRFTRLQKFVGDYTPTMVVPVGPRFQANVTEWAGPLGKRTIRYDDGDSETLKWLGVRIWPIKTRNSESKLQQVIGKGRADSCLCTSPGTGDCIKHHVLEERRGLKTHLGCAFYSWKFDEMGEEVAKSWPANEQEKFKGLVKLAASSNGNGFWKNVFKFFPSKRRESVISYYFNVYIPRGISTRPEWLLDRVDAQVDASGGTAKKYLQQKNKCKKSKCR